MGSHVEEHIFTLLSAGKVKPSNFIHVYGNRIHIEDKHVHAIVLDNPIYQFASIRVRQVKIIFMKLLDFSSVDSRRSGDSKTPRVKSDKR